MEVKNGLNDDKILIAGVIGAFSTLISEIASRILILLGVGSYSAYELSSLLITGNRTNILIGFLLDCTIGAILGGGIYLVLKRWGYRHAIAICILSGLIMWLLWEIIYTINIEGHTIERRMISGYLNHFINTITYGTFLGLTLKRFIFNKI